MIQGLLLITKEQGCKHKVGDYAKVKAEDDLALQISKAVEKPTRILYARGLIAQVNERRNTIPLVTNVKNDWGYIGTLKESDIESRHYGVRLSKVNCIGNIKILGIMSGKQL